MAPRDSMSGTTSLEQEGEMASSQGHIEMSGRALRYALGPQELKQYVLGVAGFAK
ncbi:hypothetical protein Ancab_018285, partial [Ancistrocladus abbreviatus]